MKRSLYQSTVTSGLFLIFALTVTAGRADAQTTESVDVLMVDDFESYEVRALPTRWKYMHDNELHWVHPRFMRPREEFYVTEDNGNKVLHVYTEGEVVTMMMANEPDGFDWDIQEYPRLAWDWRALQLPDGAHEDDDDWNDSGVALNVIFKMEGFLFKRPKTIKYVYSSTLPVGTVVSYGKLKVIVVSSGADGLGEWQHIDRDVIADYEMVFGGEPPQRPLSLRLWSDSDNTKKIGEADFDNIRMLRR